MDRLVYLHDALCGCCLADFVPCWALVAHQILIPRGARAGTRVVLPGEVDDPMGGAPGDVIVNVVEMRHPRFTRRYDGLDLPGRRSSAAQGRAESEGQQGHSLTVGGGWWVGDGAAMPTCWWRCA